MQNARFVPLVLAVLVLGACATSLPFSPETTRSIAIGTVQLTAENIAVSQFNGSYRTGVDLTFRNESTREIATVTARSGVFVLETEPNTQYRLMEIRFTDSADEGSFQTWWGYPSFTFRTADERVTNLGHVDWLSDEQNKIYGPPRLLKRYDETWDYVATIYPDSQWLDYRWYPSGFGEDGELSGPPLRIGSPDEIHPGRADLVVEKVQIERIFPVLFKYYDQAPLGTITLANLGRQSVRNAEVRLNVGGYIDSPKLSATIEQLSYGERVTVPLSALFNEQMLTITEGTRIAASIDITYDTPTARDQSEQLTFTLETYDRNALRWDDDEKIAAFVTSRDPEVQRLSRNALAVVRDSQLDAVPDEIQKAMAVFALLQTRGLAYVIDPSSAYAELSTDTSAVDYVQFPRQTLEYRAGDCDDLSAAYAALLEAIGVETGFITIPGHIYLAIRINVADAINQPLLASDEDLIQAADGSTWIPIETTLLDGSFLEAWAVGARQWREHSSTNSAQLYPTRRAWERYEPVAFNVVSTPIPTPDETAVAQAFNRELDRFVSAQLFSLERRLVDRLEQRPGDPGLLNRLGVLYARYGRTQDATAQFRRALERGEYAPALVNLANVLFLRGSIAEAGEYYARAFALQADNAIALLGAARADHAQERYEQASIAYQRLREIDPVLADKFSYLDISSAAPAGGRASGIAQQASVVVWDAAEE